MYSHHIEEMAVKVARAIGTLEAKEFEKIKNAIASCWIDKIAVTWSVEDVKTIAGRKMSKGEAMEVLQDALHDFDAEIGMNWDVLREHIH